MPSPTQTPTTTPVINPNESPWHEEYTDPGRICPQQHRELASPDIPV